jgi:uncharacterized membrane protein (DUF485 family)
MGSNVEETPVAPGSRARRHSPSTRFALAILLFYAVFTLLFPIIPSLIALSCIEDLVLYGTPAIALILWLAAMLIRVYVLTNRRQLVWTGFRYAVIAAGVAGFLIMAYGLATPGYIKGAERFAKKMQRDADVPAIRAWAANYRPLQQQDQSVPKDLWPGCVARLHPRQVLCNPNDPTVNLNYSWNRDQNWGLVVAPRGTQPNEGDWKYVILLQDGVWVWREK